MSSNNNDYTKPMTAIQNMAAQHAPIISNLPPHSRDPYDDLQRYIMELEYKINMLTSRVVTLEADNEVMKEAIEEIESVG